MLEYTWIATFTDNTSIKQFDGKDQTQEHRFQEVLDRHEDLLYFSLQHFQYPQVIFTVNLKDGCIHFGNPLINAREDALRKELLKYRLIYFREVERHFGSDLTEIGTPSIVYFLGFQYQDSNKKNHKRIMKLQNGFWTIN
jgi:hypothetical protein